MAFAPPEAVGRREDDGDGVMSVLLRGDKENEAEKRRRLNRDFCKE